MVVTATISGSKGDGMIVNMHVSVISDCCFANCMLILIPIDQGRCWQ